MDDFAGPTPQDQVSLYLEALELNMDPDQFRVLGALLQGAGQLYDSGMEQVDTAVDEEDEEFLTEDVMEEFLVIVGMLTTGRMDQQVVDIGGGITTVVTQDVATDPARMRELRTWAAEQRGLRDAEDDAGPDR
ncbi:hypothetical protein [Streptacidiphilus carbonis]|uniref:hypothetical protein n=1 Tax=Streptacidiphilus carbonis TaxID=105422 RepID=UPI0005A66A61|nr:hypothetical protein [Streptacidiphilus carbonis]